MKLLCVFVVLLAYANNSNGAKILGIFPTVSKSHYILGEALLRGLVSKGHHATMISPFKLEKPIKNYRDVVINNVMELKENFGHYFTRLNVSTYEKFNVLMWLAPELYHTTHNASNVRKFVQNREKYDVCIVSFLMAESMYAICNAVQAVPIGFNIIGMNPFLSYHTGNPVPYSYVPTPFNSLTDQMTFLERAQNTVVSLFFEGLLHYVMMPYHQKLIDQYYPECPSLERVMDGVDLYLMNSHYSTDSLKPLLPNVIPIGGFHLQIMDEIPEDIQKFLDNSKNGVIYFTLGSNARSADLEPHIQEAILKTFSKLKYDVLWKYEVELPNKPKNIHISQWIPQRPALMHPKIKTFLTHGGLGGISEAIFAGVPMICMPIFGDQSKNCADIEKNGYAIVLDIHKLDEEKLTNAIKEITDNPIYKNKVALKSDIYRNQEVNPMEKAVFWVEHVIRHKGAKHLKSKASSIRWYHYYLLDVIAFFAVVILVVILGLYYVWRLNLRVLCWMVRKATGRCYKTEKKKVKKQ